MKGTSDSQFKLQVGLRVGESILLFLLSVSRVVTFYTRKSQQ